MTADCCLLEQEEFMSHPKAQGDMLLILVWINALSWWWTSTSRIINKLFFVFWIWRWWQCWLFLHLPRSTQHRWAKVWTLNCELGILVENPKEVVVCLFNVRFRLEMRPHVEDCVTRTRTCCVNADSSTSLALQRNVSPWFIQIQYSSDSRCLLTWMVTAVTVCALRCFPLAQWAPEPTLQD